MQQYADNILQLTIRLEQLAKGASNKVQKRIAKLQREILGLYLGDKITTRKVLKEVKRIARDISVNAYLEIDKILFEHESATAEVAHALEKKSYAAIGQTAIKYAKMRDVEKLISDAFDTVMPGLGAGRQVTVKEMLERFSTYGISDIVNIAERAFIEGLSIPDIRSLVKTSLDLQSRQAETVARTAIQAVANQARQDIADQLPVDKEIWVATLDSKTCAYCQGQDGKCKPKGQFPRIAHPNCRCVRLYVPDDMSCTEVKEDLTRVQRPPENEDKLFGKSKPMNKYQDYGTWILTQPIYFQEEVLGKERSKLLRQGKIKFDKMYTQTGKMRTIESLKKLYL